jgi:ABC-type glycerol-3-phosphate transport system substrate-binding protein
MRVVLAAIAVLLLAACGGGESSSPAPAAADDAITDIDGIEPIREQFERDAGSARLLIVFSPT